MPELLSDTERGAAWLSNFPEGADRNLALDLLNSLSIIAWSDARAALNDLVERTLADLNGPTWMLPVMAAEDILERLSEPKGFTIVPFENYSPGSGISSLPGSEAAIGNLVRAFMDRPGVLEPQATLKELESARVRTVLLVTDFIGTGKQVLDYIDMLRRSGTIKSWQSFGWVKFVVVAYATSATAEQRLLDSGHVSDVQFVTTEPTLSTLPWPVAKAAQAIALCRRYPPGRGGLGYKSHGGLFIIQESVPNTIPEMFTDDSVGWTPLLGSRRMPPDLREEVRSVHSPTVRFEQVAKDFSQVRLAEAMDRQMRYENKQVLTLIALCINRNGSIARVESALGVNRAEAERLVAYCIKSGWLDDSLRSTALGRFELEAGKRKPRRVKPISPPESDPYYPLSLR